MQDARILVVEDEAPIVRVLEPTLQAAGASVKVAWSGSHALELVGAGDYDLILCDLGLPDIDGQDLIPELRAASDAPIIVLSARGQEKERIVALDGGADDFVPKPFATGELLARIRAALRRRAPKQSGDVIRLPGLDVDLRRRVASLDGEEIRLSGREHALLTLLASNSGNVVTHRQIMQTVWGTNAKVETQLVRVLIAQLRQKLEAEPSRPKLICTEPGIGYRLNLVA